MAFASQTHPATHGTTLVITQYIEQSGPRVSTGRSTLGTIISTSENYPAAYGTTNGII